jgi:glycosyltransferase involved in cell wall biosynthesis
VSEHDAAHFGSTARRVLVVPNGVDDELFAIDERIPDSDRVLFFGQFDYAPNALGGRRLLREVWPRVIRERPGARLRLVGKGMDHELASEARAAEGVEVVGFVDALDAELADSSVVVVSIWHGGGTRLKVLESMAAARPIAGTPLGVSGIGFETERHGLIAETAPELASAVVRLLRDRELARGLAAEARRLAERYRWSAVTEPAETLYRDWIRLILAP